MERAPPADRPLLAFAFSLAASLGFTGMGVCLRALPASVGTPETVFARGVIGGLLGLLVHLVMRRPLRTTAPGVLVIRTIVGTLSLFCYYGAVKGLTWGEDAPAGALATANLLLKTAPVWVALGAGFLLGERAGTRTWVALVVGVTGASIALFKRDASTAQGVVVLGLLAGVFAAGAYLAVRRLAASEDPLTVVTLFSVGVAVIMGPVVLVRWRPIPDSRSLLLLLGVSLCGTLAQVLMTHAYRHSKAAIVAVSGLAEVAFTVAAAMVFFGERPPVATFVGGGLAVFAGLVATWPRRPAA
jgi:S-adenosylmethionine uptake transporter